MNWKDWRKKQGQAEDVNLPSGLTVKCKRASLVDLATSGRIPKPLLGVVQQMINAGDTVTIDVEALPEIVALLDCVAKAVVVEPQLADEPDEEHLGVGELDFNDKMAVFSWANGTAAKVATFPN